MINAIKVKENNNLIVDYGYLFHYQYTTIFNRNCFYKDFLYVELG